MTGLTEVSLPDLERLAHALERVEAGSVVSREVLVRAQLDALTPNLGALLGRDAATVRAVLDAVIVNGSADPLRIDGQRRALSPVACFVAA